MLLLLLFRFLSTFLIFQKQQQQMQRQPSRTWSMKFRTTRFKREWMVNHRKCSVSKSTLDHVEGLMQVFFVVDFCMNWLGNFMATDNGSWRILVDNVSWFFFVADCSGNGPDDCMPYLEICFERGSRFKIYKSWAIDVKEISVWNKVNLNVSLKIQHQL